MNVDHNTIFLYDNFKYVPTYILNPVLCQLGDYARRMVALNTERCGTWEMKVFLHVTSCMNEGIALDTNDNGQQIADLLDKLKVRPPSSNPIDRCSICLEEYCEGSDSELIYTECSHIFHEECIGKWLHQCEDRSSSYSCPMCRREII
ncbi:RING-H2 finger protein ATL80-like [Trifolium pratense]|uniref:RING-H2 finger protein ATL80-like n=1 Tax=Trifolium pratense TaxID=57577 RepID=UPI001E690514|nr:RING-H2 finger protein ATL80-like [Trifolium pratense]